MLTSSCWNRNLPQTIEQFKMDPNLNIFQECNMAFYESLWESYGWISDAKMADWTVNRKKFLKKQDRAVKKFMEENNVDIKAAEKAIIKPERKPNKNEHK